MSFRYCCAFVRDSIFVVCALWFHSTVFSLNFFPFHFQDISRMSQKDVIPSAAYSAFEFAQQRYRIFEKQNPEKGHFDVTFVFGNEVSQLLIKDWEPSKFGELKSSLSGNFWICCGFRNCDQVCVKVHWYLCIKSVSFLADICSLLYSLVRIWTTSSKIGWSLGYNKANSNCLSFEKWFLRIHLLPLPRWMPHHDW